MYAGIDIEAIVDSDLKLFLFFGEPEIYLLWRSALLVLVLVDYQVYLVAGEVYW